MTEKPILSKKMKDRLNELYRMLIERSYTKQELMRHFKTGERQVRLMLAEVAKKAPMVSTSDNSGYYVATKPEHLEMVEHQWKENDKRSQEILARNAPLIKFRDKVKGYAEN